MPVLPAFSRNDVHIPDSRPAPGGSPYRKVHLPGHVILPVNRKHPVPGPAAAIRTVESLPGLIPKYPYDIPEPIEKCWFIHDALPL